MVTNKHPTTGIAYGVIACQSLDDDLLHFLLYEKGKDLSYEAACQEEIGRQEDAYHEMLASMDPEYVDCMDPADFEPNLDNFDPQIEEPIVEGEYQGVHYRTTWLGGAQLLWIFESPFTEECQPCSPCVPGAGNLDNPDPGGMETYSVPADWRRQE